jgi:hypothetical protein
LLIISVSSSFKRVDALRHSPYIEECCQVLEDSPECGTDVYLVQLIRLQHISERISQDIPLDAPASFWASKPPVGMYIKSFQDELANFKRALPKHIQANGMFIHSFKTTFPRPPTLAY